jgi:hypothetical protein
MLPDMTSPIDPIRRAAQLRRARKTRADDGADEASHTEGSNLPVPVDSPRTIPQPSAASAPEAAFAAQLIGQDGQRRGLRAGPTIIDTAKASYNKVEWSGANDRRARAGRITKTDI